MRLSPSGTALSLALAVSVAAGPAVLGAAPALAADRGAPAAAAPADDERALRVERSLDALYAAIDELAQHGVHGKVDAEDRATVQDALAEVFAATEAAAPTPDEKDKKNDEAVAKAKKKLKAEVKVLIAAAADADLLKLVGSLQAVPKLAVDLLFTVTLGKLGVDVPKPPKLELPKDAPKVQGLPQLPPAVPSLPGL